MALRTLAVVIALCGALLGCSSDDSSSQSGSSVDAVTSSPDAATALRSRCEELSAEPYRDHCGAWADFALEEAEQHDCGDESAFALSERYAIDSFVSGPGSDFFEGCPSSLEGVLLTGTLEGYTGLGEDQPETGVQNLDDFSAIFPQEREQVHDLMVDEDLQAVVLGHWVRNSLRESSLVIRLEMFPDVDSARQWTKPPEGDTGEPVAGVDDGRFTVRVDDEETNASRYTSLPYQQLAFGRACSVAVTVFVRSREDAVPDDETVVRVFRDQVDQVESSCESLAANAP